MSDKPILTVVKTSKPEPKELTLGDMLDHDDAERLAAVRRESFKSV